MREATVSLNGYKKGRVNQDLFVSKGDEKYRVQVMAPGYVSYEERVEIPAGQLVTLDVDLQPKPAPVPPVSVEVSSRPGPGTQVAAIPPGMVGGGTANQPQEITNSIGMKLRLIPAGSFNMGSPDTESGRGSDEGPVHRVTISRPFYMGMFEVTQDEYENVMGTNPSRFKGSRNPVENVSWDDAQMFCRKLSSMEGKQYRLPTEAEWEYACRAGSTGPFHYGGQLDSTMANFDGNYPSGGASKGVYRAKPIPVGSFLPNLWGLYDMHGNVWEWCQDWYDSNYYGKSPGSDPLCTAEGTVRVYRGGSWRSNASSLRSALRSLSSPDFRHYSLGFRVVAVGRTK